MSVLTKNTKKNPIPLWKRIRFKLIFAFLIPVVFIIVLGFVSYQKATTQIIATYRDSVDQTVSMMNQYLTLSFDTVQSNYKGYMNEDTLKQYLNGLYDNDAIISKRIWECVQLEIKRRKKYLEEHGTNSYSHRSESNPFASKIICGDCNKVFARKGWRRSTGVDRKVWQCSERYKVKGVMGCANRHVEEKTLIKAYLMAWNVLVENREDFMEQWTEQLQSENLLEGYRAEKFIEYTDGAEPLTEMDTDFMLKTLDHIKVFEDGTLLVVFLDGTEIECKNEEE